MPTHQKKQIGLFFERSEQRKYVHDRTEKMLADDWIPEVEKLLQDGYREWKPMSSVGYKEVVMYLDGDISRLDLAEKITTSTMQLIKKQTTWFKKQEGIQWFHSKDWQAAKDAILLEE